MAMAGTISTLVAPEKGILAADESPGHDKEALRAVRHRARCDSAASEGRYAPEMEGPGAGTFVEQVRG